MGKRRLGLFYRRRAHEAAAKAFEDGGSPEQMERAAKEQVEGLGLPPWLVAILIDLAVQLLRKWLENKLSSPPEFDDFNSREDDDIPEGGYE